jgi:hypothetical protein
VIKDAIVVRAEDGRATHFFCTSGEADAICDAASQNGEGVSIFKMEHKTDDAELMFGVTNIKVRVQEAKDKLDYDLRIVALMDKHGIPKDKDIRMSVFSLLKEDRENYILAGIVRN